MSFYSILNELNDYAGQREVVAEEMGHNVYGELMRYSQDLKSERKHVSGFTSRTIIPGCTYCRLHYVQCCYVVYSRYSCSYRCTILIYLTGGSNPEC